MQIKYKELSKQLNNEPNKPFYIPTQATTTRLGQQFRTDASGYGIGAVLAQVDSQGQERVISYTSRTLDDHEKNYSAMEKEALAVIFATNHFRVYLFGRQFHLVTDNRALTWLHSQSLEPKDRITRWVMDLQEFDFIVSHRPGKENLNADTLSRLVTDP